MFQKIVTIVFYLAICLWAFGVGFSFLLPILGICALLLAVFQLMG